MCSSFLWPPSGTPPLSSQQSLRRSASQDLGGRSAGGRLVDILRLRQTLLVLDNLEQVLDAAPDLAMLLGACPDLKILATSRSVLHLSGEHDLPVPPLTLPAAHEAVSLTEAASSEAVHLFIERARAVHPDFTLTETNAEALAAFASGSMGCRWPLSSRARALPTCRLPRCTAAWNNAFRC